MFTLFLTALVVLIGLFALKLAEVKRGRKLFLASVRRQADYKVASIYQRIRGLLSHFFNHLRYQFLEGYRSLRRSLAKLFAAVARKLGE